MLNEDFASLVKKLFPTIVHAHTQFAKQSDVIFVGEINIDPNSIGIEDDYSTGERLHKVTYIDPKELDKSYYILIDPISLEAVDTVQETSYKCPKCGGALDEIDDEGTIACVECKYMPKYGKSFYDQ